MTTTLSEIIKNVNTMYNENIKQKADSLELERQKCAFKVKVFNILAIASIIAFIYFIAVPNNKEFSFILPQALQTNFFAVIITGILCIIIMLFLTPIPYIILAPIFALTANIFKCKFIMKIKKEFYPYIFKAIGKNLHYYPGKIKFIPAYLAGTIPLLAFIQEAVNMIMLAKNKDNIKIDTIKGTEILPEHDGFSPDDIIWGNYNKRKVEIIEFDLYKSERQSKAESSSLPAKIFHGVTFQTNIDKTIKAKIYIKQKNSQTALNDKTLEKINLESSEFNKIYTVYSNNQVEARYFLTTSIMTRLIELYNKGQIISLWCENNDISIIKKTSKDLFEPNIYKPVNNPNSYYETLIQTKEILDFITDLKLDTNIGM